VQQIHTKISEDGRLVIPASYRKALSIQPGDDIILQLQEGEIRLFRQSQAVRRLRIAVKKTISKGVNQTDAFIAFRKQDSH